MEYDRPDIFFERSLCHIHEATTLFRENLGIHYRSLVDAANDKTKQILVFIDCDAAVDEDGDIPQQLYEAAWLYQNHGKGKVYALTTRFSRDAGMLIQNYGAFTRVFDACIRIGKAQRIINIFAQQDNFNDTKLFVFGSAELLAEVSAGIPPNRRGDIFLDISRYYGGNIDEEEYSIIDYILYYLTMCQLLQQMQQQSRFAGGKCSCLAKFLHPKALVNQHYPNADKTLRLENLAVLREGRKMIRGKNSKFVWVEHILASGEIIELHANLKWIVLVDGDN